MGKKTVGTDSNKFVGAIRVTSTNKQPAKQVKVVQSKSTMKKGK